MRFDPDFFPETILGHGLILLSEGRNGRICLSDLKRGCWDDPLMVEIRKSEFDQTARLEPTEKVPASPKAQRAARKSPIPQAAELFADMTPRSTPLLAQHAANLLNSLRF